MGWIIIFVLIAIVLHAHSKSKYKNRWVNFTNISVVRKWFVLIVLSVNSYFASAAIYTYKMENGNTVLSNKPPSDENKDLTLVKVFQPDMSFLDWKVACSKDKFNGSKSCTLSKMHSDVMVFMIDGNERVYVGRNHFPRSQSAIKIDNQSPVYGYEGSSNTPKKVVEQMKKGKIAYTRYKEWPYDYNKDSEVDLAGFAEKYAEMLEEYKKL